MFRPTTDPSMTEAEQIEADKEKVRRTNDRRDTQRLIRMVLASPLADGPIMEVDGVTPIKKFEKQNVDVQTRILLNTAAQAMGGNDKARTFLFKYAGLEPVAEQSVTVELPTFVDDMGEPEELPAQNTLADLDVYDEDA